MKRRDLRMFCRAVVLHFVFLDLGLFTSENTLFLRHSAISDGISAGIYEQGKERNM